MVTKIKNIAFCMTNIFGFKKSNTEEIKNANVSIVTKPTLSCNEHIKNIKISENIEVAEKMLFQL